jgi:hypothetical protein
MKPPRSIDYLEDFVPEPTDHRLMYYGPAYNRICARCNSRWVSGETPKSMDGVELEIEKCEPCATRPHQAGWRQMSYDREAQMDHIEKFKGNSK